MTLQLRKDDLAWEELNGEIVVLDLRSSKYFVINGAGAHLWERLASSDATTEEDLASALERSHPVTPLTARRDAVAFLDALRDRGLLES